MGDSTNLRRTQSLKGTLTKALSTRKERRESVPPLPGHGETANGFSTSQKSYLSPGKQSLVEVHITANDFLTAKWNGRPKSPAYRETWPSRSHQVKPGKFTFDSIPTLTRTPWELERSKRPASQWSRNSAERAAARHRMFERLPPEVLCCILDHLKASHTIGLSVDAKSLQSDLRVLCLSNKQLHRVAQEYLYCELWLPSHYIKSKRTLAWTSRRSPLEHLLRTFVRSPSLADTVKCMRVSLTLANTLEGELLDPTQSCKPGSGFKILAAIVKRCKNLEHFLGFAPAAVECTAELFRSLATCSRLKSHIWQLPTPWSDSPISTRPGGFWAFHDNWAELRTLMIVQQSGGLHLPPGTISAILQRLPALQHLVLSGLNPGDFHNGTLLMLPPLKSLRLEELHGVTDLGLEQLARSRTAYSMQKLSLCGLEITSLRTIQSILAEISLKRLTVHQYASPELPEIAAAANFTFTLASISLEYLHWDILEPSHSTIILANSIASGRFPRLRKVKIPRDPEGAMQQLCRPLAYRQLTSTDIQDLNYLEDQWGYYRSLSASRTQAQLRIRQSRKQPSFNVVVQDEDSGQQHEHVIGSYLGNIASKIEYSLDPAIEGTEDALADMQLATYPGPYLTHICGLWENCNKSPNGRKEFLLDLNMFF